MATTVQGLINYLSEIEDKDTPVLYQYILPEHTDYSNEEFANRVDEMGDYIYSSLSNEMLSALDDVELEEVEED